MTPGHQKILTFAIALAFYIFVGYEAFWAIVTDHGGLAFAYGTIAGLITSLLIRTAYETIVGLITSLLIRILR